MNNTIVYLLLPLLTSCAMFSTKEDYTKVMYHYLKPSDTAVEKESSKRIKEVTSKEFSMAGGNYQIKIFPITDRLVKAFHQEKTNQNHLSKKESKKLWATLNKKLLQDKTCLHFEYEVVKYEKSKNLNSWQLAFLDSHENKYNITWEKNPIFSMPALTKIRRSGNMVEKWIYEGTGCAATKIPLEKGFGVNVKPAYVQWPFPSHTTTYWEFDKTIIKDGKEVEEKAKNRTFQKYRGW